MRSQTSPRRMSVDCADSVAACEACCKRACTSGRLACAMAASGSLACHACQARISAGVHALIAAHAASSNSRFMVSPLSSMRAHGTGTTSGESQCWSITRSAEYQRSLPGTWRMSHSVSCSCLSLLGVAQLRLVMDLFQVRLVLSTALSRWCLDRIRSQARQLSCSLRSSGGCVAGVHRSSPEPVTR